MSPKEFDFGPRYVVAIAENALRRILDDAVTTVGLDVAAGACGCDPPDLRKALDGQKGRHMRTRWVFAIAAVVDETQRARIAEALTSWMGTRREPKKPEEVLSDLEHEVSKRFGPAGIDAIERARRR